MYCYRKHDICEVFDILPIKNVKQNIASTKKHMNTGLSKVIFEHLKEHRLGVEPLDQSSRAW